VSLSLHQVPPRRSPLPAVLGSAGAHVLLWLVVHRVGQAVFAPPAPGPQPFEFMEVSDIALPGTGTDPLSGPAGVPGGSPFGTPGGPAAADGLDPMVDVPRTAVQWLEAYEASDPKTPVPPVDTWADHTPSEPGLSPPSVARDPVADATLDLPTVDGVEGVPVAVPHAADSAADGDRVPDDDSAAPPRPPIVDDEAAAIRAAMLRALLEGGAEVVDEPIGLGSPSGQGGDGPFSGAGSRYGTAPDPELLMWQRQVRRQLMERFRPLPKIAEAQPELSVTVALTLGPQGAVLAREVRVSSGNPSFDAAALWAVDDGPLPPPPQAWADVMRQHGLAVRFTPAPAGR